MVKITISSKKEENFKEGDLVFGAALSWEDPGSHMDAFIVGEIDKEKFLYTFAGAVANILANTVPNALKDFFLGTRNTWNRMEAIRIATGTKAICWNAW